MRTMGSVQEGFEVVSQILDIYAERLDLLRKTDQDQQATINQLTDIVVNLAKRVEALENGHGREYL